MPDERRPWARQAMNVRGRVGTALTEGLKAQAMSRAARMSRRTASERGPLASRRASRSAGDEVMGARGEVVGVSDEGLTGAGVLRRQRRGQGPAGVVGNALA